MINGSRFYGEYHGHPVRDLELLLPALRESSESLIWTAGDSSLDNKYWFQDPRPAVGAYQRVLEPPARMNADVTYWLNHIAQQRQRNQAQEGQPSQLRSTRMATINAAVEASTVNERTRRLRSQDIFLRDNLRPEDTLVVSIGGNDIAMMPMPCTICSILSLVHMPISCLESSSCVCASPPCDEHCCGCGPVAMTSCACACPPCLGYTTHLFGTRVQKYIEKLTAKTMPKRILVCMIYYPDETATPSWAGPALRSLGYDQNPETLQYLIRRTFVEATLKIRIRSCHRSASTDVIPVPLFNVLDGKTREDYVARVEPSSRGGRKMAEYLLDIIEQHEQTPPHHCPCTQPTSSLMPVESSYISDRS
eukprot:jgi/Psemu1/287856/fgenesh1_pg.216_\